MFTVEQASRMYGIEPVDLERGTGLLLTAGTGLGLAVLNRSFRWFLDTDGLTPRQWKWLGSWLEMVEANVSRVCVCGWYSRPSGSQPLADALRGLRTPPPVYLGATLVPEMFNHCRLIRTLDEFVAEL